MSNSSVKVDINVATKAAEIALKQFQANIKNTDKTWEIFKGNLAASFTMAGLSKAGQAVLNFAKETVAAAAEAEQSSKNLSIALQNVGLTSEETFKDLTAFADGLEQVSQYSAQAIQDTIGLTAQLTTLDKDGIKQATQATVDLASALNLDLKTATDLMIKGINGQTSAFRKYGLEVQAGSNTTQTFANILEATAKFQGAAEKQTHTFAGAQIQLSNAYGKIYEEIGKLITQNPVIVSGMKSLIEVFTNTAKFIGDNRENIFLLTKAMAASTAVVLGVVGAVKLYTASFIIATNATTAFAVAAKIAWAAITGPVGMAVTAITVLGAAIFGIVKYWDDIKIATLEATAAVLEYAAKAAGVFSKGTADGLKEQADNLRQQANAAREAQKATEALTESQKKATEQAEREARLQQELQKQKLARLEEDKKFTLQLIKQGEDRNKIAQDELAVMQSNADVEREILKAKYDQGKIDYFEYQTQLDAIDAQFYEARQALIAEQAQAEQDRILQAREAGLVSQEDYNKARLEIERKYNKDKEILDNSRKKTEIKNELEIAKEKKRIQNQTLSATADMFGSLADLAEMGGKKYFAISKALNIAQITLSGIQHVMRASELPFPSNIPAMISAGVTAAVQLAKARAVQPSFATGGVVGGFNGASMGNDNVTANVRNGEMILNAAQQKTLFDIANRGQSELQGSNVESLLRQLIIAIDTQPITISIGGQVVVDTIRNELAAGRTF